MASPLIARPSQRLMKRTHAVNPEKVKRVLFVREVRVYANGRIDILTAVENQGWWNRRVWVAVDFYYRKASPIVDHTGNATQVQENRFLGRMESKPIVVLGKMTSWMAWGDRASKQKANITVSCNVFDTYQDVMELSVRDHVDITFTESMQRLDRRLAEAKEQWAIDAVIGTPAERVKCAAEIEKIKKLRDTEYRKLEDAFKLDRVYPVITFYAT